MVANAGLVIRPFVALGLLIAGWILMRCSPRTGGLLIAIGGALFLAAEIYGVVILKPFVGRYFDDEWYAQIATVDAVGTLGLLGCALGILRHAFAMSRAAHE